MTFTNSLFPDQAPTERRGWSGYRMFDTRMVFLRYFFEKVNFEKKISRRNDHETLPSMRNAKHCFIKQVLSDLIMYSIHVGILKFDWSLWRAKKLKKFQFYLLHRIPVPKDRHYLNKDTEEMSCFAASNLVLQCQFYVLVKQFLLQP